MDSNNNNNNNNSYTALCPVKKVSSLYTKTERNHQFNKKNKKIQSIKWTSTSTA